MWCLLDDFPEIIDGYSRLIMYIQIEKFLSKFFLIPVFQDSFASKKLDQLSCSFVIPEYFFFELFLDKLFSDMW